MHDYNLADSGIGVDKQTWTSAGAKLVVIEALQKLSNRGRNSGLDHRWSHSKMGVLL